VDEGGGMNDPVPIRRADNQEAQSQALKVFGFLLIFFGPILPLTIFLWRLAVGG
jgi:hypothetical protein